MYLMHVYKNRYKILLEDKIYSQLNDNICNKTKKYYHEIKKSFLNKCLIFTPPLHLESAENTWNFF